MHEREWSALCRLPAQLADDPSMDDGGHRCAGLRSRPDLIEAGAHPLGERLRVLGAGDDVPALLLEDTGVERVAVRSSDAQEASLPLPEMDLSQGSDDARLQAEARRQRCGCLGRALERRDEEGADGLAREALGNQGRLLVPLGRERRVGMTVDQVERLTRNRVGGGAVTDEDDLDSVGREGEAALGVGLRDRRILPSTTAGRVLENAARGDSSRESDCYGKMTVSQFFAILSSWSAVTGPCPCRS